MNNVKTVLDVHGNALYFSRAMIPHNKKVELSILYPLSLSLSLPPSLPLCTSAHSSLMHISMFASERETENSLPCTQSSGRALLHENLHPNTSSIYVIPAERALHVSGPTRVSTTLRHTTGASSEYMSTVQTSCLCLSSCLSPSCRNLRTSSRTRCVGLAYLHVRCSLFVLLSRLLEFSGVLL